MSRYRLNLEYTTGDTSHPTVSLYQGCTDSAGEAIEWVMKPPSDLLLSLIGKTRGRTWYFTAREDHKTLRNKHGSPIELAMAFSRLVAINRGSNASIVSCTDRGIVENERVVDGSRLGIPLVSKITPFSTYAGYRHNWAEMWREEYEPSNLVSVACKVEPRIVVSAAAEVIRTLLMQHTPFDENCELILKAMDEIDLWTTGHDNADAIEAISREALNRSIVPSDDGEDQNPSPNISRLLRAVHYIGRKVNLGNQYLYSDEALRLVCVDITDAKMRELGLIIKRRIRFANLIFSTLTR